MIFVQRENNTGVLFTIDQTARSLFPIQICILINENSLNFWLPVQQRKV